MRLRAFPPPQDQVNCRCLSCNQTFLGPLGGIYCYVCTKTRERRKWIEGEGKFCNYPPPDNKYSGACKECGMVYDGPKYSVRCNRCEQIAIARQLTLRPDSPPVTSYLPPKERWEARRRIDPAPDLTLESIAKIANSWKKALTAIDYKMVYDNGPGRPERAALGVSPPAPPEPTVIETKTARRIRLRCPNETIEE